MNIKLLIRPELLAFKAYKSARKEYKGAANIFLDANENNFFSNFNRYPDPEQSTLKQRIAEIKKVTIEQAFVGNGSDEVLDLIIRAFCIPYKDQIITLDPSYGMYEVLADLNAIKLTKIQLNDDFSLPVKAIQNAVQPNTKMIVICNPNNPTGNYFPKEKIIEIAKNFNGLVIVDEAYIDFCKEEDSCLSQINDYENIVITQTLSKAFGLAALRVGFAFANEIIIDILNAIKPPYNVSLINQKEAENRLRNYSEIKKRITKTNQERQFIETELEQFDFIQIIYPSATNFILIKVKNAVELHQYLLKKGIIIRLRHTQTLCKNCVRITVGNQAENRLLIDTLKTYSL